jgi:aldehyde:ferredoxin oxidoreductase
MGGKLYGYAGKTLEINLSNGKIEKVSTNPEIVRRLIGGMGFSAKTVYDNVGREVDPLSIENIVVFSAGALTGTDAPASSRTEISTKSPLTGIMGTGNTGGFWGVALKRAGYDAIIVRGRSEDPVYLAVDNGRVELKDAKNLWGKDTKVVTDVIKKECRKSGNQPISVLCIGIAGENQVRYACPVNDYYHVAGRCHAGAVMGSKKLKAISVRGTGKIELAKPEQFKAAVRETRENIRANPAYVDFMKYCSLWTVHSYQNWGCVPGKNYQTGVLPHYIETRGKDAAMKYITKPEGACFGCTTPCFNLAQVKEGKYAGVKISSGTFASNINTWGGNCAIDYLPAIYKCKEICHLMGMDYGSTAGTIAFAMELYQRGIINENDTDGLKLEWGDDETVIKLIEKIAHREGLGNILAEGSWRAANMIGKGAERYSMSIKGLEMMWADPRGGSKGWAFGYLTSPRGGDNVKSTHGRMDLYKSYWTPEKYDMFPEVKANIYGEPPYWSPFSWEGKAAMTIWFENLCSALNALGMCFFSAISLLTIGPTSLSRLFSSATGWDVSPQEMMIIGERIFAVLKGYEVREGLTRKDDSWPERFYEEPMPEGPAKGITISREEMAEKLSEYYKLRGWSVETGVPPHEKFVELGLHDIADDLSRLGKLS